MSEFIATLRGVTFIHPWALYLLGAVALVLIYSLWGAGSLRRIAAPILRAIVLALFVVALAQPEVVTKSQGTARPAVIDASASITRAMRTFTVQLLQDKLKLRPQDPALMFGDRPVASTIAKAGAQLDGPHGCGACAPGGTNLQAALEKLAADPAARNGPIVLVTDGWQNRGDAAAALAALRAAGIRLEIFTPPGARSVPNVAMTGLNMPPALEKAAPFALGVSLNNLNFQPVAGAISIYRNNTLLDRRAVTIAPGDARYDFPVRTESAGLVSYRAVFKPDNAVFDRYSGDDSLQGWVGVGAQRKVLILTDNSRDASYLDAVIRRTGFQPATVVLAKGEYDGSIKGYDAIILNNVPRARLSPAVQNALVHYVDQGGALAMVGGDRSFGLGGYENSPIARIMPVVMEPPRHRERTRALVLIIDKSGSMGRDNKLVYAKAAARTVTDTLKGNDLLSVIGFDSQPFVIIPLEPVEKSRPYFDELVNRLVARGTTYLLPALEQADRTLAQSGAALKHVVILTDGETGGTASMYYDLVSSMHRQGGVTISAIAIGDKANTPLLQAIARYGGGAYYQTDSPENLPKLFLRDVNQHGGETTMAQSTFVPHTLAPNPILGNLGGRQLPAIKGFVGTTLKTGATLSAYVDRGGERQPLIAGWKYGAGKTLAVTTDASGRWSGLWIEDGIFGPLWDRMFGWMAPRTGTTEQNFTVALGYRAGRIVMKLTDYSDNPQAAAQPIDAAITAPGGFHYQTILSPDAPGELAGDFEASRPGTYYIGLHAPHDSDITFPPLAYTVSAAIDAELPQPSPNYGLLEQLAAATGGRLNPSPSEITTSRPVFERRASLSLYLIIAAMILLIAEALVRRLTF
ncbi:MAG: VWA domain-containing protein [Candidatus Binataceae bacterium]